MRVSDFMPPAKRAGKKHGRDRTTYRAARRNIAKIDYRRKKREKAA